MEQITRLLQLQRLLMLLWLVPRVRWEQCTLTQNANNVSISGGTIGSASAASIGTNSYGARTVSASNPAGGSNGDIWYKI